MKVAWAVRRAPLHATALGAALLCTAAHAERFAILVGVSQLAVQPRTLWLDGPRHDVAAVQTSLAAQGISRAHTTVLADGVPGATPPTQAAILAALDGLTPRLQAGDSVLLYWSGHGVRSPAPPKASQEPDGLDEYLLARDAQRDRRTGRLQGAVHDAALGARIDAWQARGAQVFVVFDTCHAASSTRDAAATGLRWRGLEISQLRSGSPRTEPAERLPAPQARPAYAAFYASESHQRTPEWKGAGLFTQALLAAWAPFAATNTPSYRTLATATLQQYQRLAAALPIARSAWPSPLFEGDLDAPLWGRSPPHTADSTVSSHSGPLPSGVRPSLTLQRPGQAAQPLAVNDVELGRLPAGTQLTLAVDNTSGASLDMALLYQAAGQPARSLYPALAGDSNRLEAGTPSAPVHWQQSFTLTDDGTVGETLLLALAPALPRSLPRRFGAGDSAAPTAWQTHIRWQVEPGKK
ncbi:caspase family protein [Rhodoferax sp.]|uniref:caspase family protein n=1 Tax=Rhodoferax sp. TaxID=50421 RepID=UPI0025E0A294|nr:caspase family protein [Rhodoferax sp.]